MRLPRFLLRSGVSAGICLFLASCSPKEHDAIVAKVGDTPITLSDYERLYMKSGVTKETGANASQPDREKFLDLMVKYHLKLEDAYGTQLDRRPDIVNELEQYKGSLAASYVTDRQITTPGMRRLYDQRNEEVRASHILISLAPNANPQDSAAAYAKAYDLIKQLKAGADFAALAKQNSQDPSAQVNGGDLYYFMAGQMVPPFEHAVFAMKPGEISNAPIRTSYGVHVIKVVDRKPAEGERNCSHIMIRFNTQNPAPEDTLTAFNRIKTLQDSIKAGVDFAALAQRHSEDPTSAPNGGDLGWFGRRRWPMPFDEVAFTLKPGQVSDIVRTAYGYHLIKCGNVRPRKTFEEAKPEIQQIYQQLRFQDEYNAYLGRMKSELHYVRDTTVTAQLLASLDTAKTTRDSAWAASVPPAVGKATLLTVADKKLSVDSVLAMVQRRTDLGNLSLRPAVFLPTLDKVSEQVLWSTKADLLAKEDPAFADIMREYKDGILLYQIEQERVWNNIALNDTVLREYFNSHREDFRMPDRLRFTEIRTGSNDLAAKVSAMLKAGETMEQIAFADSLRMAAPTRFEVTFNGKTAVLSPAAKKTLNEIAATLQADPSLKVALSGSNDSTAAVKALKARRTDAISKYLQKTKKLAADRIYVPPANVQRGLLARTDTLSSRIVLTIAGRTPLLITKLDHQLLPVSTDERTQKADSLKVGENSAPFWFNGTPFIVRLDERVPSRLKTFDEANGDVSSAYQDAESKRLESAWIDSLKAKYQVVEHREVLKSAFGSAQAQ